MKEKRQFVRFSVPSTVRYRRKDEAGLGARYEYASQNISIDGIHLVTHERLSPGTIVQLQIENNATKVPILATGRVSWVAESRDKKGYFDVGIQFSHLDLTSDVKYQVLQQPEELTTYKSRDISEEGISFTTNQKLKLGTELVMEIALPFDTLPVTSEAKVAWVKKDKSGRFNVGVKFTNLRPEDKDRIQNYIADVPR